MFSRQNFRLDKTQPALVVQHGNTSKKHFYLTERGMTLGNASGCDIQLAADEVSAVHCIITHSATGLFVRECSSRFGINVNGVTVTEAPLNNGDLLQVGPFVFEVSLPRVPSVDDTPVDYTNFYQKRIEDLEKSRERLVLLAWHQRRRLLQERLAEKRPIGERPAPSNRPQAVFDLNLDELETLPLTHVS